MCCLFPVYSLATPFHHVVVQQEGGRIRAFVDGIEMDFSGVGANARWWTHHLELDALHLGRGPDGYFRGILDEVRTYSRSLDEDQIHRHFHYPDLSGKWLLLHHNTHYSHRDNIVAIRGIPIETIQVFNNHYMNKSHPGEVVWQYVSGGPLTKRWNTWKNGIWQGFQVEVFDNVYGRASTDSD